MQRAANKKYHVIYKTTCLITNKFYVGMHSTNNLNDGYMGSGKRIKYSLNKHGVENHKFEILEFAESRNLLAKREEEIITESFLSDPLCMNIRLGGSGGFEHINSRRDFAAHNKKLAENRDYKDPKYLKLLSETVKAGLERAGFTGWSKHDTYGMLGKSHSVETKDLMRNQKVGELNPQFGKCWVHHLEEKRSMRILKDEMEMYLQDGWIKGRKMFDITHGSSVGRA